MLSIYITSRQASDNFLKQGSRPFWLVVSRLAPVKPASLCSRCILLISSSQASNCDFMVLLGTEYLTSAYSVNGPAEGLVEAISLKPGDFCVELCIACKLRNMASIPPSAFSAGRIRQTQQKSGDMKISKTTKVNESQKYFNTTFMELSPLKYNSKLMNSIWGLYNRYSPHNVKKINDANSFGAGEAQPSPANKNESTITLPSAKLDNVWAAMKVSQTH